MGKERAEHAGTSATDIRVRSQNIPEQNEYHSVRTPQGDVCASRGVFHLRSVVLDLCVRVERHLDQVQR